MFVAQAFKNTLRCMPLLFDQGLNHDVLDILVQSRRNTKAADRFFRKLFKQYGQPRVLVTDKLGSYGPTRTR